MALNAHQRKWHRNYNRKYFAKHPKMYITNSYRSAAKAFITKYASKKELLNMKKQLS